jgi:hypothetical protein
MPNQNGAVSEYPVDPGKYTKFLVTGTTTAGEAPLGFNKLPNSSLNVGPAPLGLYTTDNSTLQGFISPNGDVIPVNTLTLSATTYNGDGSLAAATVNGIAYTFTYSSGKLITVVGGGLTKTFSWTGNNLTGITSAQT